MNNSKSSSTKLLREVEELRKKLSEAGSPLNNNEIWSIQQALQVTCGHLLITFQEIALEKGIERDLWNFGFRTTITQLQSEAREKKKGSNDAKDLLHWFLNAASGFYLQLLNQICSVNSLDLVFRRKDSVYGLVGGGLSSTVNYKVKDNVTKNALYLCQYCLIHLGDLARYRHQAKQAETYYRHAVTVAATSGHPYNQLALLEAGRGNRLTSVFLYIRALCVNAPFPGAPSNLIQTLSKVLSSSRSKDEKREINEIKVGTLMRMTKEEYINLFLHFHSSLFLKGDLEAAKVDLPRLSSALSMLVATTTLTRSSLVQMFSVTVFALHYFSSRFTFRFSDEINKKEEEDKLVDPNECEGSLEVLEESMVGMLAALLLPIHTMKEPEVVITYPALPAIRLMFEWVALEDKLSSAALKKKQQIWPGLCTLINFLQQPLKNFDAEQYKDTPLPEDWDLQEFQPLQKILNRYKYRESSPRLSPEQYSLIRAQRLWDLASKFCQENVEGSAVIKMWTNEEGRTRFEATSNQTPPVEEVLDLERLTLQPRQELAANKKEKKVGILKPQGSLERSKATVPKEHHQPPVPPTSVQCPTQMMKDSEKKLILPVGGEKRAGGVGVPFVDLPKVEPSPTVIGKHKTTRTNVALQAILKRNSNTQEMKQVTFQTPSPAASPNPSDDTSTESQRSPGISTPPLNVAALLPRNPSPASLMPPHPMGLSMPPPSQNQPLPYHQRFPPPFRAMDHPSNPAPPQASQNFPPSVTATQSYSHGLSPGTHTTRGDQPPYLNIRPSPPKGVFGPGSEEIGSYFPSPPQGLGMIRPPQEQSLFNRTIRGPFDTQPNPPGSSLYGNLPQAPINWKNAPSEPPLGPSPPHLKNNPNFRGMFNSTRALDVAFKEGGEFQPPNFPLSLQTFSGGKPPKENTSPLTMFMDNGASRGMGNPASPGNSAITHGGNLLQQISSGPSQTAVSNLFQGAPPGSNSPWWNKDAVGAGTRNNNAYQFSQLGLRSSFHGGSVSPPSIDTSIPPPHMGSSQFPNPGGLAMPGGPASTAFSSDPAGPLEGNNGSLRMSNTYSLFGPLGGGREPLQQPFPPNNGSAANRMLNPSSKQSVQPQQQFPSPHSLWSGPSPLQRLLEQKKFSTK